DAPDGTGTATKVTYAPTDDSQYNTIFQQGFGAKGAAGVYLRAPDGETFDFFICDSGSGSFAVCTLTDQWQRFSMPRIGSAGTGEFFTGFRGSSLVSGGVSNAINASTQDFYMWGAQVEDKPYLTSYIPTPDDGSDTATRGSDIISLDSPLDDSNFSNVELTATFTPLGTWAQAPAGSPQV